MQKAAQSVFICGLVSRILNSNGGDAIMQADGLYRITKIVGWVVLALMVIAIFYACITGIRYWSGIGV